MGGGSKKFEHLLTEHIHIKGTRSKNPEDRKTLVGFGWPSIPVRWCTHHLKDDPRQKFFNELKQEYNIIHYVGLAADEEKRIQRKGNQRSDLHYPLVDWGMTEADCLKYCYEKGFDWDGLYEQMDRVSCWCCPFKTLKELRNLYENYPDLWKELKRLDDKTWNKYRRDFSVWQLEYRFEFEKKWVEKGYKLRSKLFFQELYKGLEEENERRMLAQYPAFNLEDVEKQ